MKAVIAFATLVSTTLCLAGMSLAQVPNTTSFQVEQFEPLPSQGTNLLNLGKSEVLSHLRPSFGLMVHYVDDAFQLVLRSDQDAIRQRLVDSQLKGEVWAALGLFDFMDIGVVMPLVFSQNVRQLDATASSAFDLDSFATGDLRASVKFRLLDPADAGGFGIGLMGTLSVPTGDENSYNSDGEIRIEPRLLLDWRNDDGLTFVANIGYMPRPERQIVQHISDDVIRWGVGAEIPIIKDAGLSLIGDVFGSVGVGADLESDEGRTLPIEALGGLQLTFAEDWVANAGAGAGLNNGVGSPDLRIFASIGYTPRTPVVTDIDGDGLPDEVDKCPTKPEDKDTFQDEDGCPDPDNDGDGVPDVVDGGKDLTGFGDCRDNPEDKDGFEDEDGCPDPDNDGDGILDLMDGPLAANGFGGCANIAEDKDGFEDGDGCPDLDNDNDSVLDVNDGADDGTGFGSCRNDPENLNNYQDDDGCPDTKPVVVFTDDCSKIEIGEKVQFKTAKAKILPQSFGLLNQVADVMQIIPEYEYISVEGHTDSRGSARYNKKLSQRRAKSVREYLLGRGIPNDKLRAFGFGEERPIAPNDTKDNLAKNRRVEFNVIGANCTKKKVVAPQ
ncbi:MAG: outer membrane protein OmpA-like peptidoglycan-associated protein [Myxococcota bacterium]|jgi:outer membrane protein OmpA-like peptidoglycan-associated protein